MCFRFRRSFSLPLIDFLPSPAAQHLYSVFLLSCVIYNFIIHYSYFLSEKSAIYFGFYIFLGKFKFIHNFPPSQGEGEKYIIQLSSVCFLFNINKLLINFAILHYLNYFHSFVILYFLRIRKKQNISFRISIHSAEFISILLLVLLCANEKSFCYLFQLGKSF